MALKKIAEYTFDNSVKDCLPIIYPSNISVTKEDEVSGTKTTRTLYIDETLFPVQITFEGAIELLTVEYLRIDSKIITLVNNFFGCTSLTSINTTGFDTNQVTNMDNMFQNCSSLTSADLTSFNTTKVNSMYNLFRGCTSLRDVNLSSFDTSNVTAMNSMFEGCSSLIKADITNFNTTKVTRMGSMFSGCKKITHLDLSNFDTNAVTNMDNMFNECSNLIVLCLSSNFNTKNVTSMISMFYGCSSLESLDLSSFETSKVVYMNSMFQHCKKLTKLDLSNFNTSSVQYTNAMFLSCTSLMWVNVSSFDTSQLKYMPNMFEGCGSLTSLDLSSFTTNQVVNMTSLFANSPSLTQVDLSNFKINNATTTNMFGGDANLKTIGVLYCDYETINEFSSLTPPTASPTYYYYEANESDLTGTSNVKFEKYVFPSIIQLPPHIKLNSLLDGTKDELDLKTGILVKRIEEIDGKLVALETPKIEKLILNHNNSCDYAIKLPTGVADKYDVVNSLYTQNVNSIFLDGSYSWESLEDLGTTIKFTATGSSVGIDNLNMKGSGGLYCDNRMFPNINDDSDVEHCRVDEEGNKFYFFVNKTRLMSPDLIGWQYWLVSNNFTLYYEMNESETYSKLYEELDPAQASWEMLDCIRGGEVAHDTNGTNGITLYPTMEYVAPSINNFNISMLEPTTEYTIYAKNTNNNQTLNLGGATHSFTDGSKYLSGETQWVTFNGCDTVDKVVIIKGDTTNDYVPYFTGIQSVKMPVLTSVGKNLFHGKLESGRYTMGEGTPFGDSTAVRTIDKIKVKPSTKYTLSVLGDGQLRNVSEYNNGTYIGGIERYFSTYTFETSPTTNEIHISFQSTELELKAQLEESSTVTSYEPYKSNILTCNEEVILCGMDEARDELNLVTGEFTQRIQERILDGTETWITGNVTETYQIFRCESFTDMVGASRKIICDKYPYSEPIEASANLNITFSTTTGKLCIVTSNLNLSIDDFKAQLSADKPKVQYQLAAPTVKTVNLQYNICAYEKLYRAISRTPSDMVHVQVSSEPNSLSPLLELECSTASASTEDYATIENNIKFDGIDKATLKGQTLVNLLPHCTYSKIASENSWEAVQNFTQPLIIGKKYFISVNVVKNTFVDGGQLFYIDSASSVSQYGIIEFAGKQGRVSSVFTPSIEGIRICCELTNHSSEGQIELTDIILMEYQEGMENWGIPYFTGMQSVKTPILKSMGKNLFTKNNLTVDGYIISSGLVITQLNDNRNATDYIEVLPDTMYTMSGVKNSGIGGGNTTQYVAFYDKNKKYLTYAHVNVTSDKFSITTSSETIYIRMSVRNADIDRLQIEKGSIATPYEPHKSNTLSYNEEVTLRAIGDVKDELNLLTGEFTQRISEAIIIDETVSSIDIHQPANSDLLTFRINQFGNDGTNLVMANNLTHDNTSGLLNYPYGVSIAPYTDGNCLFICLPKSVLSEENVNGFKEWLSLNPVTIQYALATSIVKVIDLAYINENNEELSYNDTTMTNSTNIILNGNTPITPNVVYALPSKNSFYLVNIKTGTRYTLKYPSGTGQISIGNLSYAVTGSSVLFMTPFEITGDKNAIVFSDEDPQDVILVEGDYSNIEVPYFTGIKSVENPIIEVYNRLTTETVQYKATSSVTLRSLPNGVADTLDIVTGMLTQMINQRPYEEGDESLTDVWTDGENTIYGLTSPIIRNITFPTPIITSFSTIKVFSNHLIPQLKYRALSSNNFPLDLLQPNKTYTLYATVSNIGSYTLGGTYTGNFFGTTAISLGDVTSKSLIFNSDVGASNVMLIEGDTTKSTVPYFLGILSVEDIIMYIKGYKGEMNSMTLDDDVVLNGFGENRDIIDLTTGILTKKTGQIILTGAENWIKFDDVNITDEYVLFRLNIPDLEASSVLGLKCDKFSHVYTHQQLHQSEGIYSISTVLNLCVKKSTIGGDNVTMLKLWLSRNNVKVVYPLATPVTIQLKNLWLSMPPTSYYTKTIIIDSTTGNMSLKPIFTATVAITALEEVVSNLETQNENLQAQNEQLEQENIATMLALTEMYETMSMSMPMTMPLGDDEEIEVTEVSSIGMVYANLINKGLKTIDQVPYFLQAEVKYALSQM